jgi:hypothetical protein
VLVKRTRTANTVVLVIWVFPFFMDSCCTSLIKSQFSAASIRRRTQTADAQLAGNPSGIDRRIDTTGDRAGRPRGNPTRASRKRLTATAAATKG